MSPVNGHRYIPSTAVFLNEIAKLTISLTMALYDIATHPKTPDSSTAAGLFGALAKAVFSGDGWKMAIPAMLFTLQNNLQYIAISNLDAATFQVTSQLKILTTAVFSVVLLGRTLSGRKWFSLLLLTMGVAIVHLPMGGSYSSVLSIKDLRDGTAFHEARNIWDLKALGNVAAGRLTKRSATYEGIDEDRGLFDPEMHASIGLSTLAVACIASSLGSVYFEKILKEPKNDHPWSIWVRNVQLSFYSLWPALFMGVLLKDGSEVSEIGFFAGYNGVVWATILLQAGTGVLIAFVIKHADNIAKNFATSIAVMISFLASVLFFDFEFTSAVGTDFLTLTRGDVLTSFVVHHWHHSGDLSDIPVHNGVR